MFRLSESESENFAVYSFSCSVPLSLDVNGPLKPREGPSVY